MATWKICADIQLNAEKVEVFEKIVARFESDWHQNMAAKWLDYLPDDDELRACLVAELPEIEAEFRQRVNQSQSADNGDSCRSLCAKVSENASQNSLNFERSFNAATTYSSVLREIRGGLGDVYVIRDGELNRVVVVKQLQAKWIGDQRAEHAFEREVKITSLLEHPNIVPVHTVGKSADGRPFYCMRYVEGQTMQQAIDSLHQSQKLDLSSLRNLLSHFVQTCRTIAFANSRGIIHRDLKPANIVIGQYGETSVLDWGLAKELQNRNTDSDFVSHSNNSECLRFRANSDAGHTDAEEDRFSLSTKLGQKETQLGAETTMGEIVGTPAFMSPEQASGRISELSIRTDVFGLGSVLYAILFGKSPFVGKDAAETIQLASCSLPDFHTTRIDGSMKRGLVAICRKAMSSNPNDRYPDAQSLAIDVEAWMAGENISIQKQPFINRLGKTLLRRQTLATLVGLLLIATISAILVGMQSVQSQKTQTLIASKEAEANRKAAKQVADYVAKVFKTADVMRFDCPGFVGKEEVSARSTLNSILAGGYELFDDRLQEFPESSSELLMSLGIGFRGTGNYQRANELFVRAIEIRKELYGVSDYRTLECEYQIARLLYESGQYIEAEGALRNLIATIQFLQGTQIGQDGAQDSTQLELLMSNVKYQLAWLKYYQPLGLEMPQFDPDSLAESQRLFREVLASRKRRLPPSDRAIGLAYAGLSASLFGAVETEKEAVVTAATAMEILNRSDQESSFGSFLIEYNKAETLRREGNFELAEKQYLKLSKFIESQVGEGHSVMAVHQWNLAGFYRKFGTMDKAELAVDSVRRIAQRLPALRSSVAHLDGLKQYAQALVDHNRNSDAIEVLTELLQYANERPEQNAKLIADVSQLRIELQSDSHDRATE